MTRLAALPLLALVVGACGAGDHPELGVVCDSYAQAVCGRLAECGAEPGGCYSSIFGACCADDGQCSAVAAATDDDVDGCVDAIDRSDCASLASDDPLPTACEPLFGGGR